MLLPAKSMPIAITCLPSAKLFWQRADHIDLVIIVHTPVKGRPVLEQRGECTLQAFKFGILVDVTFFGLSIVTFDDVAARQKLDVTGEPRHGTVDSHG